MTEVSPQKLTQPNMQLNTWQRIGVFLSILWILGAGYHSHKADVEAANTFAQFSYKVCSDTKMLNHDSDLLSCDQERKQNFHTQMKSSSGNVAFAALAPVPFFWLGGVILLNIYRMQIVGFRSVVRWETLNPSKKTFVVFCMLSTFLFVLCGIVALLNLYVDARIPVSFYPRATVVRGGDEMVAAKGTWVRSGDSPQETGLRTSTIECYKQERVCAESTASVFDDFMTADVALYDVESWTDKSVTFRNAKFCATEVYTIDLESEAASGSGHLVNQDTPLCKMMEKSDQHWTYRLADGFPIYWEIRQKARPLPLRLIQTLFGN